MKSEYLNRASQCGARGEQSCCFCLSCQQCLIRVTEEEADKKEVADVAHAAPVAAGYFRNLLVPSLVPSGPPMFLATPRPTPRRLSGDVLDGKIM